MKCPTCHKDGYEPPARGRPPKLDPAKVKKLKGKGLSGREIARRLGVTEGAVRASLKRSK